MTTWIQRGKHFYAHSPIQFVTQSNSSTPVRQTLKVWVPREAESYRIKCSLYRGVADSGGNVDVAGLIRLPGWQGQPPNYDQSYIANFDKIGQAALSDGGNGAPVPEGTLVESLGSISEIPNMEEREDWAVFYWLCQGNTLNSAEITIQLLSYRMP